MSTAWLARIAVYPVKSAGGVRLDDAVVEPWGLRGDRRWALVDAEGSRVRAVELPAVMGVTATPAPDGGVTLSAAGRSDLVVAPPPPAETLTPDRFFGVEDLILAEPKAHEWLSEAVGVPVRLVWQGDPATRALAPEQGGRPGEVVSLADTGPLLLTSAASLRRLDDWIAEDAVERGAPPPEPLSMTRFRPNVVVDGFPPFVEDEWAGVRIGDVEFRTTQLCDRCAVTTIDPGTLEKGKEPIRTLARYRRWDGLTWFGIRLAPLGTGTIRVGDPVTPLTKEPDSRFF
jgi:uncharacterized protein YcbX